MLDVRCESCQAPYQVDERRVPATGLRMRCPKCGHSFVVQRPAAAAAMVAAAKVTAPARAAATPPRGAASAHSVTPAMGTAGEPKRPALTDVRKRPKLRSISDAEPSLPVRSANLSEGMRPTMPELPAVVFERAIATKAGTPPPPVTKRRLTDVPDDLPSRPSGKAKTAAFGELDWGDDLPAAPVAATSLGDFLGDDLLPERPLDLPSRPNDLPSRANDLPQRSLDLPSRPNDLPQRGLDLPTRADALPQRSLDLPTRADALPERAASLPQSLDALPAVSDPLPLVLDALPGTSDPPFANDVWPPSDSSTSSSHGFEDPLGFGELELPPLPADDTPPPRSAPPISLPGMPAASTPPLSLGRQGDFGELDLGPLLDAPMIPATHAPASPGNPGAMSGSLQPPPFELLAPPTGGEFSPPGLVAKGPGSLRPEDSKVVRARSRSRAALFAAALLLVAGGAIELTEYGAFGRHAIADALHGSSYAALLQARIDAFQTNTKSDLFVQYTTESAALHSEADGTPRAWDLAAFAAYAEAMTNVRFGADVARDARADGLLSRAKDHASKPLLTLARIARQASPAAAAGLRGELAGAGLSGALATEAALLDGELALLVADVPGAAASFDKARELGAGARADFGVARTKSGADAKAALEALLVAVPQHAGARIQLAALQLQAGDKDAAMATLAQLAPASTSPRALAEALALRGNLLLDSRKTAEARAAFDEAFRLDPTSEAALLGQGESFLQSGRYTEALARFEGAAKLPKATATATIGIARTKLQLEAPAEADALLTAARLAAPDDPQLAYWLGEAKRRLGKTDEALVLFEAAEKAYSTTSPEAFLPYAASAKILSQRGEDAKALATLDAARKKLPASVALDRAFGDLAATGGRYDVAIGYYREASARGPQDWSVHLALADLLRKSGKLEEASKELDLISAADHDFPGLTLQRGVLLEQSGKLDEALAQFKTALAAAPDDLDRVLRVGAAYLAVGSVEEALPLLERVQRARPDSAEAQHYLGRAKLQRGGPFASDSLRLLKRAAELDPNNAQFHVYVAWAANESTPPQVQIAREEADRALAIDKQEADAYWQRGVSYLKEGAFVSAQDDLRKAVLLKPERAEAHAALAECYEGQSQFTLAVSEWKAAIARDPKPAYWRYRYGRLLAERGAGSEAATHLEYAVSEGSKAAVRPGWLTLALFQEAQTFRKVGRNKDALAAYREYVASAPASAPDRRDAEAAIVTLGGGRPPEP